MSAQCLILFHLQQRTMQITNTKDIMTHLEFYEFFTVVHQYCFKHELTKEDLATLLSSLMLDITRDNGMDEEGFDLWCEYLKKEYRRRAEDKVK